MRCDGKPDDKGSIARPLQLAHLLLRAPNLPQDHIGPQKERLPDRRQGDPAHAPNKQLGAEGLFKLLQVSRDRRLSKPQHARCSAHATGLGNGHEVAKLVEFHGRCADLKQ